MKFNYSQIESYCNELKSVSINMRNTLEDTKTKVNSLTNSGTWEGQAANYYKQKFLELSKNFEGIYQTIDSAIVYMQGCSDNYEKLEKQIMNEINSNLNLEGKIK